MVDFKRVEWFCYPQAQVTQLETSKTLPTAHIQKLRHLPSETPKLP